MKTIPIKIKAGDERVLLNGFPPKVDVRVISEDYYQELKAAYDSLHSPASPECVKSSVGQSFGCDFKFCSAVIDKDNNVRCDKCNKYHI